MNDSQTAYDALMDMKDKAEKYERLVTLMDNVLPEESVLYKPNHKDFAFYTSSLAFEDGCFLTEQQSGETFSQFIDRTILRLLVDEARQPERLVTTDYAIHIKKP